MKPNLSIKNILVYAAFVTVFSLSYNAEAARKRSTSSIVVDENGLVTAHSAGKVKVTATSGSGKKATCTVTVTK